MQRREVFYAGWEVFYAGREVFYARSEVFYETGRPQRHLVSAGRQRLHGQGPHGARNEVPARLFPICGARNEVPARLFPVCGACIT